MREPDGYLKPDDFWEVPNWVAILRHNIKEADFVIVRNIDDFVQFLNASDYHYICFSVLEANKHLIREIIERYTGNATFALGGYIDLERYFGGYDNVATFETLKHFIPIFRTTSAFPDLLSARAAIIAADFVV
jgi:hypothetical protein